MMKIFAFEIIAAWIILVEFCRGYIAGGGILLSKIHC